jgi:hypothetical protein
VLKEMMTSTKVEHGKSSTPRKGQKKYLLILAAIDMKDAHGYGAEDKTMTRENPGSEEGEANNVAREDWTTSKKVISDAVIISTYI